MLRFSKEFYLCQFGKIHHYFVSIRLQTLNKIILEFSMEDESGEKSNIGTL